MNKTVPTLPAYHLCDHISTWEVLSQIAGCKRMIELGKIAKETEPTGFELHNLGPKLEDANEILAWLEGLIEYRTERVL